MAWRASETVLRIARANDIAPRNPEKRNPLEGYLGKTDIYLPAKNSMCWKLSEILGFLPKFNKNESG